MSDAPKVSREEYAKQIKAEMEGYLASVIDAVNEAPDGAWIAGSEEQVRDLSADFRRQAFEKAVQMRVDAAEAAFPPPPKNPATGKRLANKGRQDNRCSRSTAESSCGDDGGTRDKRVAWRRQMRRWLDKVRRSRRACARWLAARTKAPPALRRRPRTWRGRRKSR
jgi:hypothetical protein